MKIISLSPSFSFLQTRFLCKLGRLLRSCPLWQIHAEGMNQVSPHPVCSVQVSGNCAEDAGCSDREEGWSFSSAPAGCSGFAYFIPESHKTHSQGLLDPLAASGHQPGEMRLLSPSAAFLSLMGGACSKAWTSPASAVL